MKRACSIVLAVLLMTAGLQVVHASEGLLIRDGMAQPILTWTDLWEEDYSNASSDILRYFVYVETDYDTDHDGMADLVKVLMQVPKAAVLGEYQAAVILDPTPYSAGTVETDNDFTADFMDSGFDYDILYDPGEKRVPSGTADTLSHALETDPSEWMQTFPYAEGQPVFSSAQQYDYYLVRGFAVAQCPGIGTYGSEGFELCGMDLERDAQQCVVEWLAGNRPAYTDLTGNVRIEADWSNHKVAMTGASYGGTLPFEVAVTGVEGLETIIPVAGIASWYNYTNSQGVPLFSDANYTDTLALYNAGAEFVDHDWTELRGDYGAYLAQIRKDQDSANGKYTPLWESMDYSLQYEGIRCSALIVQGLNDNNVTPRQADLMYRSFKKAGAPVKMLLHQNAHVSLDGIMVGDMLYQELINRWLCHYLYGVDNHIEELPEVQVQSNVTGKFVSYDHWREFDYTDIPVECEEDTRTVTSRQFARYVENATVAEGLSLSQAYLQMRPENCAIYDLPVAEGTTIFGVPQIHLQLSTENTDMEGLMITAALIDVRADGKTFPAFVVEEVNNTELAMDVVGSYDMGGGMGENNIMKYVQEATDSKLITRAWTDLAVPGGGESNADYREAKELEAGTFYPYTLYMTPTVYTVQPGHVLKLVLFTWDFATFFLDETYDPESESATDDPATPEFSYGYTIDQTAIDVKLPVRQN